MAAATPVPFPRGGFPRPVRPDPDPLWHNLIDLFGASLCGVIGGARDWSDIHAFAVARQGWLARFLELPGGVPLASALRHVFSRLDAERVADSLDTWTAAIAERLVSTLGLEEPAPVAGGENDPALGHEQVYIGPQAGQLSLGRVSGEDWFRPSAGFPAVAALLDLNGALVMSGLRRCGPELAAQVRRQGGDYLLGVAADDASPHNELEAFFGLALKTNFKGLELNFFEGTPARPGFPAHACWVVRCPGSLRRRVRWADLAAVVVVLTTPGEKGTPQTRRLQYHLTSRVAPAEAHLASLRRHWRMRACWQSILDLEYDQTGPGQRDHGPANLDLLHQAAASLLRQVPGGSGGVRARRLNAAWDTTFLEQVLLGARTGSLVG